MTALVFWTASLSPVREASRTRSADVCTSRASAPMLSPSASTSRSPRTRSRDVIRTVWPSRMTVDVYLDHLLERSHRIGGLRLLDVAHDRVEDHDGGDDERVHRDAVRALQGPGDDRDDDSGEQQSVDRILELLEEIGAMRAPGDRSKLVGAVCGQPASGLRGRQAPLEVGTSASATSAASADRLGPTSRDLRRGRHRVSTGVRGSGGRAWPVDRGSVSGSADRRGDHWPMSLGAGRSSCRGRRTRRRLAEIHTDRHLLRHGSISARVRPVQDVPRQSSHCSTRIPLRSKEPIRPAATSGRTRCVEDVPTTPSSGTSSTSHRQQQRHRSWTVWRGSPAPTAEPVGHARMSRGPSPCRR